MEEADLREGRAYPAVVDRSTEAISAQRTVGGITVALVLCP